MSAAAGLRYDESRRHLYAYRPGHMMHDSPEYHVRGSEQNMVFCSVFQIQQIYAEFIHRCCGLLAHHLDGLHSSGDAPYIYFLGA